MTAPTLTTDRLTLRPMEMADFPAYAAFLASEEARHMDGPLDEAVAWAWFTGDVAAWELQGHGGLTVTETATSRTLGHVAVTRPPHFPEVELGWFLFEAARGQGFATEAAGALRAHLAPTLPDLVSYIGQENAPSIRLAERLGARPDPDAATPGGEACLVYRHPRPEPAR